MKRIALAAHASADELEAHYRNARDPVARSQFQILWLLARGRPRAEVAAVTGYSTRWIGALVQRYTRTGRTVWAIGAMAMLGPRRC
jgi:DNA-binding CsgD family transcriptional regulator